MKGNVDNHDTDWVGLSIGIKNSEIDGLIKSLEDLKNSSSHFHLRGTFEGESGISDVEIYSLSEDDSDNLNLDSSAPRYCSPD